MADCVNALKEWTGKARATVVYDSTVDEFTDEGLFEKVKGKRNIAVVGFTTDGDVFGGFYRLPVTEQFKEFDDSTIFAFSFESHGRCATPQRFAVKEGLEGMAHVRLWENNSQGFVWFAVYNAGWFYLGKERSNSNCCNMSHCFEGLQNTTLTGNVNYHCIRLVAIQLE